MTKRFYKVEHILVFGNNVEEHINNTMNDDLDLASVTFTANADPHKNNEVTAHLVWGGIKDVEPVVEEEDTDPGEDVEPVFTEGAEPPAENNAAGENGTIEPKKLHDVPGNPQFTMGRFDPTPDHSTPATNGTGEVEVDNTEPIAVADDSVVDPNAPVLEGAPVDAAEESA